MKTQSRALQEWRRQVRKSWRATGCQKRSGVVHFARTEEAAGWSRPGDRGWKKGSGERGDGAAGGMRQFLVLVLALLGCLAWLTSLLWP